MCTPSALAAVTLGGIFRPDSGMSDAIHTEIKSVTERAEGNRVLVTSWQFSGK